VTPVTPVEPEATTAAPGAAAAPSRAPSTGWGAAPVRRPRPGAAPAAAPEQRPGPGPELDSTAPPPDWPALEEDFGRWERRSRQCDIQLPLEGPQGPELMSCRSVRLDQQVAGLLSIRFLPVLRGRSAPAQQLLLAGVLMPGSQPMRCLDRRCQPQWPMRVQLSALATSNVRTLSLPQARVVQGSCSLEPTVVLCTARDHEGRRWQAKVRW